MLWETVIFGEAAPSNGLLNNIISYWKADTNGSFPDAHWSNDMTISWATYTASWLINWWYILDWTNDYIAKSSNTDLQPLSEDFAYSIWMKTTATWTKVLMCKWPPVSWSWNPTYAYVCFITYADGTVWFRATDWTTSYEVISSWSYNDWDWHHLVWYRNWNNIYLYIDNSSQWSTAFSATLGSTWALTIWNFSYLNASLYFGWTIDEFWYWKGWYPTTDQIEDLYNSWSGLSYDSFTT